MVNVATGNLVVSAMDVDIPEQGIDLALQRVYNSQSLHDASGDDGGAPSIFGNRWTKTLDASIVYAPPPVNTITVYDIDGAACVYTSAGKGVWAPCAGVYATLMPTDSTDCTYMWTKPNGTSYWFHADVSGPSCSIAEAQQGQLAQIVGRNSANSISFAYFYSGVNLNRENITEIDANHSDGDTLKMYFGQVGSGINELSEVQRPDGGTLEYLYDTSGNLVEVDKPETIPPGPFPIAPRRSRRVTHPRPMRMSPGLAQCKKPVGRDVRWPCGINLIIPTMVERWSFRTTDPYSRVGSSRAS